MTCHIGDEQMRWELARSGPPNTLLLPVFAELKRLLPADRSARKRGRSEEFSCYPVHDMIYMVTPLRWRLKTATEISNRSKLTHSLHS
jgi:hypothetical protein